jgi:uncharacterized protein YndB with AHSA1/START domain
MAAITHSIEIARPPEEVFGYLDQLERHGEWQEQIVWVEIQTEGATHVGTRVVETRKVGGRTQRMTYEITEHDPPRSFSFRGLDGPLRPVGRGRVEPLDGGSRARATIELDLEAHGFLGKLLRPLALSQARKQVPKDQEALKAKLEGGATS